MDKNSVKTWQERIVIPTYMPDFPDKHPMFLEKRVYQGSSGKIYPLPFTDRISDTKTDREWTAIYIENQFLKVMILPEIGGRIHAIFDKSNNYDLIYKQEVIKPALVGLAGSWISGGIEFNWAQHHRPATFLPVNFDFEEHADGSKTVWLGDHEPMSRMKGMHGVCLYPDRAYVELKARVTNRTPFTQTFLWWANVATKVHEGYQSFFPPDVEMIADHAKRAMSDYPHCNGKYYGVDYAERAKNGVPASEIPTKFVPPHCGKSDPKIPDYSPNDLSWYANIPVPTSYMCVGSQEDFFGGYDHLADAGIVHIADHHISPGKKQWTWGNHDFGYAWDRNLSDDEAPYIELMAGVFTDNQPDFSFLNPWETKSWSQYWYGIGQIGVPQKANLQAAVSLKVGKEKISVSISVTENIDDARIVLKDSANATEWTENLSPEKPFLAEISNENGLKETDFSITIFDKKSVEIISYQPKSQTKTEVPEHAREPLSPEEISSVEELFLTGLHLEQYRHVTRKPEIYWLEALRRDSLDSRCNNAMGLQYLRKGEFEKAIEYFEKAIQRLTKLNPNPANGESFYNLGLALRYQLDSAEEFSDEILERAYSAFYKAAWNEATAGAAYLALAKIDCLKKNWLTALEHLNKSLVLNTENLQARNLKALILDILGREKESKFILRETLFIDKLDWFACFLSGEKVTCDLQTKLDIAHELASTGFYQKAIELLSNSNPITSDLPTQDLGTSPLIFYTLGWLYLKIGNQSKATEFFQKAANEKPDYCFPNRLEEIAILETAIRKNPGDSLAPYYLGNLFYDRKRYNEAIKLWERSAELNGDFSIVWRNLGIAYFNVEKNQEKALQTYEKAFSADKNARLLFERDQLWKRVGKATEIRLSQLEKFPDLVTQRDDLTVEICAIYNQLNQPEKALDLLKTRHFQPWEGGEGQVLQQFVTANLLLGKRKLFDKDFETARNLFLNCLNTPKNLSETHHLLTNKSDIFYWLGLSENCLGNHDKAQEYWQLSASAKGDFQEMSVTEFSEMTFFSALSMKKLGQTNEAEIILNDLLKYSEKLEKTEAKIDYFATSLPTMLLFDDNIQKRQQTKAMFMQAQAFYGLGQSEKAETLIAKVLENDPNHQLALTLLEINL